MFAISYDPVDVLASFSERHGVSYHLLSDEGSRVMGELGLLNRHVEAQQSFYGKEVADRHVGIPYPGTLVLDERGVVASKHFEQSYRDRASGSYLVHQVGAAPSTSGVQAAASGGGAAIRAWVDVSRYRPLQKLPLHVQLRMDDGVHIYTDPVPEGYVALSVRVVEQQQGLQTWPAEIPAGRPFRIHGLDEEFFVLEGVVDLTVPFKLSGRDHDLLGRNRSTPLESGDAALVVLVRYQACTGSACFAPQEVRLPLRLAQESSADPPR